MAGCTPPEGIGRGLAALAAPKNCENRSWSVPLELMKPARTPGGGGGGAPFELRYKVDKSERKKVQVTASVSLLDEGGGGGGGGGGGLAENDSQEEGTSFKIRVVEDSLVTEHDLNSALQVRESVLLRSCCVVKVLRCR